MNEVIDFIKYVRHKAKENYSMMGQTSVQTNDVESRGELILKQVIESLGLSEDEKIVFHTWENLERACVKLCTLISRAYPGKHKPLLDEVICDAFEVYSCSSSNREPDICSMVRFLNVLADASYSVQKHTVYVLDDLGNPVTWPVYSCSLQQWAESLKATEIHFSPASEIPSETLVGGRTLLSSKIMSMNDLGRLAMIQPSLQSYAVAK